jgi:hypothetical protein
VKVFVEEAVELEWQVILPGSTVAVASCEIKLSTTAKSIEIPKPNPNELFFIKF